MTRDRIGYLHVPKAAGSSVTDALRRAVLAAGAAHPDRVASICPPVMDRTVFGEFDGFDRVSEVRRRMVFLGAPDELARYDVVLGHFSATHLRHGRRAADVATVLREPESRLLSHYTYWRSWTEEEHASWDPYDGSRRAARLPWELFLTDETVASQTDNIAARLLLDPHPLVPRGSFIRREDRAAVARDALAVLAGLGFVDVVEHAEACWERLADWCGLHLDIGRDNVTDADAGPPVDWSRSSTRSAAKALSARTAIDRQLWIAAAGRHRPAADPGGLAAWADELAAARFDRIGAVRPRRPARAAWGTGSGAPRWRRRSRGS